MRRKILAAVAAAGMILHGALPCLAVPPQVYLNTLVAFDGMDIVVDGSISTREFEQDCRKWQQEKISSAKSSMDTNAEDVLRRIFGATDPTFPGDPATLPMREMTEEQIRKMMEELGATEQERADVIDRLKQAQMEDVKNNVDFPTELSRDTVRDLYDFIVKAQAPEALTQEDIDTYLDEHQITVDDVAGVLGIGAYDKIGSLFADSDKWGADAYASLMDMAEGMFQDTYAAAVEAYEGYVQVDPWQEFPDEGSTVAHNPYYEQSDHILARFDKDTGIGYDTSGREICCHMCGKKFMKSNANYRTVNFGDGYEPADGWTIDELGHWQCLGCYAFGRITDDDLEEYRKNKEEHDDEAQYVTLGGVETTARTGMLVIPEQSKSFYETGFGTYLDEAINLDIYANANVKKQWESADTFTDRANSCLVVVAPADAVKDWLGDPQLSEVGSLTDFLDQIYGDDLITNKPFKDFFDSLRDYLPGMEALPSLPSAWDEKDMRIVKDAVKDFIDTRARLYNNGIPVADFWPEDTETYFDRDFKSAADAVFAEWPTDEDLWTDEMEALHDEWMNRFENTGEADWLRDNGYFDKNKGTTADEIAKQRQKDIQHLLNKLFEDDAEYTAFEDTYKLSLSTDQVGDITALERRDWTVLGWVNYRIIDEDGSIIDGMDGWNRGTRTWRASRLGRICIERHPVLFKMYSVLTQATSRKSIMYGDQVVYMKDIVQMETEISGYNDETYAGEIIDDAFNIYFMVVPNESIADLAMIDGHYAERIE